jgi:hypothetical protein
MKQLWDESLSLYSQGKLDEALELMLQVETHAPGNGWLLANIGVVYRDKGELGRAEQYLRRACATLPDNPSAHFNLALTLLRGGRLEEGFQEYEWRWRISQFQEQHYKFSQPVWRGEPLEGRRILLYGEQGAGDTVQFVRYASLVRMAGADVTIYALAELGRLMSWMDGGYRVNQGIEFDFVCPLMSLPQRFGSGLNSIPPPARFWIPGELQARWAARLRSGRMNVGVVWAGNPKHPNDRDRSLPAQLFVPLTRLPGIQCWSLQVGPRAADIPEGVVSLAEELTDFGETAAAILGMDLVVTADTAVAHIAGSLGKRVWLLAAHNCDWRWLLDREDSPWYPSLRIFRRKYPGDWNEVMERVAQRMIVE